MNLKAMRAAALKAAQDIVAKAKAEDRDLTAEEITEVEAKTAEVKGIDEKIAVQAKSDALIEAIGGMAPNEKHENGDVAAKSLGEHFVKHAGKRLAQLKSGRGTIAAPEFVKAATDTQVTEGPNGPVGVLLTQVDRTVVQEYRRPTITDLFGQGTTDSQAITYFVEAAREGNFATVAEAGTYAQLHYGNPTARTDAVSKIGGFIKLSDEMIDDLSFLVSEINGRLLYDLSLIEEGQVLSGNGTGQNLQGLLNRSGIQTEAAATKADLAEAIFRAKTKVVNATGLTADALVINPVDYQELRLSKDDNGQYYGGGFFTGQYGSGASLAMPDVWDLRTVVTPAVAVGKPVVGAFNTAATVYHKGGVRVESTNTNDDDFTNGLVTIRADKRLALAVRKPAAFVKLSVTP